MTLMLNIRRRNGSRLASTNFSTSGWSQRIVAIMAPLRIPADIIVLQDASHTSIKDNGPEASEATPTTSEPCGRIVLKSYPIPPPCCMVSTASFRPSKIPPMLSSTVPITKQLNRVTLRSPVPAPALIRPAGRNLKLSNALLNTSAQCLGSSSLAASALAIRDQVSCTVRSIDVPSYSFSRYFMSHICSAIGDRNTLLIGYHHFL